MDRTLIVRHCALKDMYDDRGCCETKIRKYESYYWTGVADGNGENMCSDCMLQCLIHQLKHGGGIPQYYDEWMDDFDGKIKKW